MVTKKIDADARTVLELFGSKNFYVIPGFQREYIWKRKPVTTLLSDLLIAFSSGTTDEYFLGSVVVYEDEDRLSVVDGQQRLTTLFVLVAACRDRIKVLDPASDLTVLEGALKSPRRVKGTTVYTYRIENQFKELAVTLKKIADGTGPELTVPKASAVDHNLINAYRFCQSFLETQFGERVENIQQFFDFIWEGVELVEIRTGDMQQAFTIFETINYRGVTLDAMDLLKNLLLMQTNQESRPDLVATWKSLLSALRAGGENRPIRFLRYFLVADHEFPRMPSAAQVFEWLSEEKNRKLLRIDKDPCDFAERLASGAETYSWLSLGLGPQGSDQSSIYGINLQRSGVRQHLCLLLAGRHLSGTAFDLLADRLEALVLVYAASGVQWNRLEALLPIWTAKLREIKSRDALASLLDETVEKEIASHTEEFANRLTRTDRLSPHLLRYVVASLTQFVEDENNKKGELADLYKKNISIEHILPQSAAKKDPRSKDALNEFKPKRDVAIEDYVYALGNLALLYRSPNSSGSDNPYSKKQLGLTKSTWDLTRSLAMDIKDGAKTRTVRTVNKYGMTQAARWSPSELTRRHSMMLSLVRDRWRLDVPGAN